MGAPEMEERVVPQGKGALGGTLRLAVGVAETWIRAVLTNYAFEPDVSETHLQMRVGNLDLRCVSDTDGRWRFLEHVYERVFAAQLPLGGPVGSTQGT